MMSMMMKKGHMLFKWSYLGVWGQNSTNWFYKITQTDESDFEKIAGDADTLAGMLLEIKRVPAYTKRCLIKNMILKS